MNRKLRLTRSGSRKAALGTIVALAGFATASVVGVAIAKTFALHVARNASVTNQSGTTKAENIVVTGGGRPVYTLSGDSARHPKCTKANGCFSFWPPVTVASAKKLTRGPGIRGKLGVWHRNGFFQVVLAGHPLYHYAADRQKNHATGEGINGFGGTWHVVQSGSSAGATTPSSGTTTNTMPTTTYTTPTTAYTTPTTTNTTPTTTNTTTTTATTTSTTPTTTTTCAYPPYC